VEQSVASSFGSQQSGASSFGRRCDVGGVKRVRRIVVFRGGRGRRGG
jgi:hypothetical protein